MVVLLAAFASGALFGAGLAVSQMINPEKVLAFLDVSGNWDPSLGLVMAAALAVSALGFQWSRRRARPMLDNKFHLPTRRDIDTRLALGAIIFGIGWGLAGYCPGPAIAAIATGAAEPAIFLLAMFGGSFAARAVS